MQKWIESLLRPKSGKPLSPATINSYLSGLRSYWEWMQSHDHVPAEHRPFWDRKVNGGRSAAKQVEEGRNRFEPADVVRLGRPPKRKVIRCWRRLFASPPIPACGAKAYAGCVKPRSDLDGILYMHVAEKSEAGVRDVPIHSAVRSLLNKLAKDAVQAGFLIHTSGVTNKREGRRPRQAVHAIEDRLRLRCAIHVPLDPAHRRVPAEKFWLSFGDKKGHPGP